MGKVLILAVIGIAAGVLQGCAAAPAGDEYRHIEQMRTDYGSRGHYKFSDEHLVVFSAGRQPKPEPADALISYCRQSLGGSINSHGPALLERRGRFLVCEVNGWPEFLFFNGAPVGANGQINRLIAEPRKGVSADVLRQRLIDDGYLPGRAW